MKTHTLNIFDSYLSPLYSGWQPGIQENAAQWDEDWDKFEDEGVANILYILV